ncbi:hypothetical protein AZE42_08068, partial [Rhizopogon vesiculosus]
MESVKDWAELVSPSHEPSEPPVENVPLVSESESRSLRLV